MQIFGFSPNQLPCTYQVPTDPGHGLSPSPVVLPASQSLQETLASLLASAEGPRKPPLTLGQTGIQGAGPSGPGLTAPHSALLTSPPPHLRPSCSAYHSALPSPHVQSFPRLPGLVQSLLAVLEKATWPLWASVSPAVTGSESCLSCRGSWQRKKASPAARPVHGRGLGASRPSWPSIPAHRAPHPARGLLSLAR